MIKLDGMHMHMYAFDAGGKRGMQFFVMRVCACIPQKAISQFHYLNSPVKTYTVG